MYPAFSSDFFPIAKLSRVFEMDVSLSRDHFSPFHAPRVLSLSPMRSDIFLSSPLGEVNCLEERL